MTDSERLVAALERVALALESATAEMRTLRATTTDLRHSTERLCFAYGQDRTRVIRLADRRETAAKAP